MTCWCGGTAEDHRRAVHDALALGLLTVVAVACLLLILAR